MYQCIVVVATFVALVAADTPANCTYGDVQGKWIFQIGSRGYDNTVNCSSFTEAQAHSTLSVTLHFPDVAIDQYGNKGFWTLIYNQGFEVVIDGYKYFAFSNYTQEGQTVTSYCDSTLAGWTHTVFARDWGCYVAHRAQASPPKTHKLPYSQRAHDELFSQLQYRQDPAFVAAINKAQSSWRAAHYPEYDAMTVADMIRRAGGLRSRVFGRPGPAPVRSEDASAALDLPAAFDWRNVDGVNFVSPIRNQGSCGSCYAFASAGMNECRIRVRSNNTVKVTISPQDVVECSEYSQGCEGGFPYLIGGKYAEDFGLVDEECNAYKGKDGECTTLKECRRHYAINYRYVGGFYGACNEALMQRALVADGPLAVSFEVYPDLMHYKSGVYHHVENLGHGFNPWEITNHVVVIVGYGTDRASGEDYWLVKNSWGEAWGESGFFRIRRSVDECGIESIAVETDPIV